MNLFAEFDPAPRRPARLDRAAMFAIRDVTAADLPALASLAAGREGGTAEQHARTFRAWLEDAAETGRSLLLVAELAGEVIAFAKCRHFAPPSNAAPNSAPAGWYLAGVVVDPGHRRRGVADQLTRARLSWIAERVDRAYYFANARNAASIALHEKLGIRELTRDFSHPAASFEGGVGILFEVLLKS